MNIDAFYTAASMKEQRLMFVSEKEAIRFRLRLYNERKRNKFLPEITILVRKEKDEANGGMEKGVLIAGPKGFDLMAEMSEETKRQMEEIEKKQREEFEEAFKDSRKEKNTLEDLRQAGRDAMAQYGFGVKKEGEKEKEKEKEKEEERKKSINPYEDYDPNR